MPADEFLARLPRSAASLAVLAGAGVSLDSPANLLAGWDFMDAVLSRIMPAEVSEDVRRSLIQAPKGRSFRPGEYIRFETLMMELSQSGVDRDLHVLDCLDDCERPNANHYVLAELIRRGAVVMTTNFDRLIEIAYRQTMTPGTPPLRIVYDDRDFPPEGPSGTPTLWKLHGSLSLDGQSTRASVQATIVQVMWPSMSRNKRKFLEAVIAGRDMLLVGYSGSDDLDLVPVLADAPGKHAMLWVNHVSATTGSAIETALQFVENHKAFTQYEVVGRDRVFFARGEAATPSDAGKMALVSANTAEIMARLRERYCSDISPPTDAGENEFGSRYPDAVRRYFDSWSKNCSPQPSTRYACAIGLLENRRFRPDVTQLRNELSRRYRELLARADATPEEQLSLLLEEFNSRDHPDPPTADSNAANQKLADALEKLIPQLPHHLWGTAHRLSACAVWNQDRRDEAEAMYRLAWDTDRTMGQVSQELATLTTWQRVHGAMRDHLSESEHRAANYFNQLRGEPIFPDDAFHRLRELAEQTGYKLNIWQHLLETFDIGYVEEDAYRKQRVREEARNMLRVAVDVGDVIGEAKARFLLALSLHDGDEDEEATVHIAALLELGKLIDLGEVAWRAGSLLEIMGTKKLAAALREKFAASMWV